MSDVNPTPPPPPGQVIETEERESPIPNTVRLIDEARRLDREDGVAKTEFPMRTFAVPGLEGVKVTIPADMDDWPIAVFEAQEQGRGVASIWALIGEKQKAKLLEGFARQHQRGPTRKEFNGLADKVAEAAGLENSGN